jgi:hypothetical protein
LRRSALALEELAVGRTFDAVGRDHDVGDHDDAVALSA